MKKALLVLLLLAAGYWVGTGAAAIEWKAFRFWYGNREALPMLEARATWALDELDAALPTLPFPALQTQADLDAFVAALQEDCAPEEVVMPPSMPRYTRAQLEAHLDRSASFKSYANVREAARDPSFHQMIDEHMSMLGQRLDSARVISIWSPLKDIEVASPEPAGGPVRRALGWQTALNLSTRERLGSMPYVAPHGNGAR